MGHCPFCKGAVNRDLLVNGGTCPHCLIEIPGEEAPTDPGMEALARQHAEEAASRSRRPALAMVGGLAAVALVCTAGWFLLRPPPPAQVMELDEWSYIPLGAHQNQFEPEASPEELASNGGSHGSGSHAGSHGDALGGSHSGSGGSSNGSTATGGQLAQESGPSSPSQATFNPTAGSIAKQVEQVDPTAGISSTPGLIAGPGISIGSRDAAETMTDPAEITEMIKRIVSRNSNQLQDCYNDRLKVDEGLQGRWRVAFEVQKTGAVSKIAVSGLSSADGELELCMTGKLQRWRFSRIANPQQVSKTYNFTH